MSRIIMVYWEPLTRDNLPILCVYMFGVIFEFRFILEI